MLQNLHVKNLALIDETEVEFGPGLNILSGETGAGKSIIIGSINLALGEKVQKEMLRDNGESALVELIFFVEDADTIEAIRALDIEMEDDTVILSRKITGGRAIGRINGEAVSASKMKAVASLLIDIHGQHEHQSLLSKKKHLEILDTFAKESLGDKKEKLAQCYQEYRKLKDELEHANLDGEERARELSFLEYEVKEIEDAQLTVGEDEELEAVFRKYSNGKKIMDAVGAANAATSEDDESASERIGRALRELSSVSAYDERVKEMEEQLTEIDNLLSDFNHELASYLSDEEFDEETFYETEKRLDLINHLKSKYGNTIADILKYGEEKAERITVLNDYDAYLAGLQKNVSEKEKQLEQLSREVSDIRKKESKKLTESIKNALLDLNFLDVQFMMEFAEIDYTANGIDDAQFLISTNPGEPVKPLGKVASGGELSRIMLAIKTVMASDKIGTLIFDEIDSGISGRTAQMVSEKMNALGRSHQIICITHLPQIAAMADSHFLIEKSVENQATVSKIHKLTDEESVEELARMLGGVEITDTVLENAREMKQMAYMKK
ncbi:MAG: DNA repair protein RecN [Agathobacter sp.]|nr:DNA repair protein RecN [Lachnospiraceae bacterium]MDY2619339.1 DNA repair protein RecN [Agathobacter sp.]